MYKRRIITIDDIPGGTSVTCIGFGKKDERDWLVVVFDGANSFIQNKATGEINWLREENWNYLMDLWIMPIKDLNEMKRRGFGRQP